MRSQRPPANGATVELESAEISAPIKVEWDDIVSFRLESLLVSLDEAAEHHHAELSKYFFSSLDTITAASGNQVDAAGKSYFEYDRYYLGRVERPWDHLALSIVCRDRHWVAGLRALLDETATQATGLDAAAEVGGVSRA